MNRNLHCDLCGIEFLSGYEMARHFRSKKHRDKSYFGKVDLILASITKHFKELMNNNESS